MYSMWNAPSDRDYYNQFNPEPPEDEEPEPELLDSDVDPFEVPLYCEAPLTSPPVHPLAAMVWDLAITLNKAAASELRNPAIKELA